MNYFKLFHLEQSYNIDQKSLQHAYLEMNKQNHPDSSSNAIDKHEKVQYSMLINEAFKTLENDYLRAAYLLKLNGQELDDNIMKNSLSNEELEMIFDEWEMVDQINDKESLINLEKTKQFEKKNLVDVINTAFEKTNINQTIELVVRLKYLDGLINNIRAKIKKL